MAKSIRDQRIEVKWKRFRFTRKTFDASDDLWKRCVYVIADPKRRPLYIGRATGAKYQGFGERYVGNSGSLSAIAHGSGNSLYVGRIKQGSRKAWYERLERELIALESQCTRRRHPRYNIQHKYAEPDGIPVRHTGIVPRFYHRR